MGTTDEEACDALDDSLGDFLRAKTGNRKLWIREESDLQHFLETETADDEWLPSAIDVWVHAVTDSKNLLTTDTKNLPEDLTSHLWPKGSGGWRVPFRGVIPKVMLLISSKKLLGGHDDGTQLQEQLGYLLTQCNGSRKIVCGAMLEPSTWWKCMSYSLFYQTWLDCALRLLVSMVTEQEDGRVKRKGKKYDKKSLHFPSSEEIRHSTGEEWD